MRIGMCSIISFKRLKYMIKVEVYTLWPKRIELSNFNITCKAEIIKNPIFIFALDARSI